MDGVVGWICRVGCKRCINIYNIKTKMDVVRFNAICLLHP
jgi:hypothetical protein